MCEMLTIVGKKLEEVTKDKKRLDGYFVILDKWSKNKVCGYCEVFLLYYFTPCHLVLIPLSFLCDLFDMFRYYQGLW